ncbi:MAG: hypothetical protein QNJ55_26405 [Xenococcus sp. MO_188.B8]|nr:hypothetical protein [Xenococcus sp. MO_188.B8]
MKSSQYYFWFVFSIISSILFSIGGLKFAFQVFYTIQDDARQHIFWMQRFSDSSLFTNDLIADYFQSLAPEGFINLYRFVNSLGIDIFFFNKISPLLIGLATTIYCFKVCLEIFPVPFAGFLSTLLLNQNLWMVDDLSSGTPRAFIYPLFLAFIYYLLRHDLWLCLLTIILQGLFYPQTVLLSATVLLIKLGYKHYFSLFKVEVKRKKRFLFRPETRTHILRKPQNRAPEGCEAMSTQKRRKIQRVPNLLFDCDIWKKQNRIYYLGLITSVIILAIYSLKTSSFAPIITLKQAKLMPEFASNGRNAFFTDNLINFWLLQRRSGWLPIEWQYTLICSCGLIVLWFKQYPEKFSLVKKINYKSIILLQIIIASTILFFLSHVLLFRLHLPSRYIHHSLRIVLALLDGIAISVKLRRCAIAVVFNKIIQWLDGKYSPLQNCYKFLAVIILITLLLLPTYAVQSYPHRLGYVTGKATQLYQFIKQQPSDYLIATLSKEADNIPSFSAHSVLVAEEYAIPYHQGYYQQIRQRIKDLIRAQYSLEPQTIINFIHKYGIDLWLVDNDSFNAEYLQNNQWLQQFDPEITEAISIIDNNQQPILSQIRDHCTVFETPDHIVWKTDCLLNSFLN